MTFEQSYDIIKFATPILLGAVTYIIAWAWKIKRTMTSIETRLETVVEKNKTDVDTRIKDHKSENEILFTKHDGRLARNEELIDHMVRAGEGIKQRLDQNDLILSKLSTSFDYISKSIDEIKVTLKEQKK